MTPEQVTLTEQIAAVRVVLAFLEKYDGRKNRELPHAIATLQQHERLTAVVEAAKRFRDDATGSQESLNSLWDALDAADPAGDMP